MFRGTRSRSLRLSAPAVALLALVALPVHAWGQARVIIPSWTVAIICPGESVELVLETKAWDGSTLAPVGATIEQYWWFSSAGGTGQLDLRPTQANSVSTDPKMGRRRLKITPQDPPGSQITTTFKWAMYSGWQETTHLATVQVTVIIVPCDKKAEAEAALKQAEQTKGWQNKTDTLSHQLLDGATPQDAKQAAASLIEHLKSTAPTKRCTSGKLGAAVNELEALIASGKFPIWIADLPRVRDARQARIHDAIEGLGKLEEALDPSSALIGKIKSAGDTELLDLLARVEAANEELLRRLADQYARHGAGPTRADGPDATVMTVLLTRDGGKYRGHTLTPGLKLDQVVDLYDYDLSETRFDLIGICRAPGALRSELGNRADAQSDDKHQQLLAASAAAGRLATRTAAGVSLVRSVQTYHSTVRSGNTQAADAARSQVERFAKQVQDFVAEN